MAYVSTAEATAYVGEPVDAGMIAQAEGIVNAYCGAESFESTQRTDRLDYCDAGPYVLSQGPIISIDTVGGVDASSWTEGTEYLLTGRMITFAPSTTLTTDATRGHLAVQFTHGFATIPEQIKQATLMVVKAAVNHKDGSGISEFSQGDLTIKYGKSSGNLSGGYGVTETQPFQALLSKYKLVRVYS